MTLTDRKTLLLVLLTALLPLAGALTAEYGFGLKPCVLCVYQRIPYYVLAGITFVLLVLPAIVKRLAFRRRVKLALVLGILACLVSAGIAGFHTGVEKKWWEGTHECGGQALPDTVEDLRAAILAAPLVKCDEPAFVFLSLSMATWNMLYGLGAASVFIYLMRRKP